jgi:hypothetical protein
MTPLRLGTDGMGVHGRTQPGFWRRCLDGVLSRVPETIGFRNRHYTYGGMSFALADGDGAPQYPFLMLVLLSEMAGQTR